jgi:hypothetical protein
MFHVGFLMLITAFGKHGKGWIRPGRFVDLPERVKAV